MLVFDTESDDLLEGATKIHVINLIDRETGARESYHDHPEVSTRNLSGTLADGVERLREGVRSGRTLAGHNVLRHDIPLIAKFFDDFTVPADQIFDTLLISRLIWTDLEDIDKRAIRRRRRPKEFLDKHLTGRHSLQAWGYRLGVWKGDFDGPWDTFTEEMQDYGIQDPETTLAFIEFIEKQAYSDEAIRLEHRVAEIIFLQERRGVYFDVPKAERLAAELTAELAEVGDHLRDVFKPWFKPVVEKGKVVVVNRKVRGSATLTGPAGETWKAEYTPDAPYTKVKLISFEPNSRDMIADRLKALYGWTPIEFTPTGKPKVDETTLDGLDAPEAKLLIKYLVIAKLLGTLVNGKKAWLTSVKADSRIYSPVNTNGAVTGRMTHADHMAQVPKIKVDGAGKILFGYDGHYGFESRSLFRSAPGLKLAGVDAEGLELRMLAHYMGRFDGGTYAKALIEGNKAAGTDAHSLTQKAIGTRTRDGAKTWMYAYLYGAGDPKLGKTHYEDMSEEWREKFNREHPAGYARDRALAKLGRRGRTRIETGFPALGELQKEVRWAAKHEGQVRSLDGRMLNIRAQHSALNTLLQGGGAVVMKKALVLAYDAFLERGWQFGREFAFVLNVHDEFQMEVMPEHAEEVGAIASDAIRRAGEAFSLRCPLSGSSDIGETWADTH